MTTEREAPRMTVAERMLAEGMTYVDPVPWVCGVCRSITLSRTVPGGWMAAGHVFRCVRCSQLATSATTAPEGEAIAHAPNLPTKGTP